MALARLEVTAVRNLRRVAMPELARTNIYYGDNGSGKTSVLESIHLLGLSRSFRSSQIKSVISHESDACTVFGEVIADDIGRQAGPGRAVGVSRGRDGSLDAKITGQAVRSSSELAELLPLQLIHADSFNLLVGGPNHRRQFLDWGVFHVEHRFYSDWQRFQRCIKQRNSLLRHGKISGAELQSWNREFSEAGEQIHRQRSSYFSALRAAFGALIGELSGDLEGLELRYRRGWDKDTSLIDALVAAEPADRQQGFTHVGPQRADIRVVFEGHNAADTLSRGQQKLVVCALKLAQGQLLEEQARRRCIYLVDDLPAELDREHCRRVAELLNRLNTQVFITCVEKNDIAQAWPVAAAGDSAMFHVEHGVLSRD
jgi:DNA replication and repair protein RecF